MSESGYQEIDLENPGAAAAQVQGADDFEIVEENAAPVQPEPEPVAQQEQPAQQAAPAPEEEDDGDDDSQPAERKRLTRSQRLKAQRDLYAQQLAAAQQELQVLRGRATKSEAESLEAAAIGLDLYIQNLDSSMRALRSEFDAAFDAGDRSKIFEIQQRMAELAAEKKQAEKEKRSIPPQAARNQQVQSGPATQPQTPPNPQPAPQQAPNQLAVEWAARNQNWFQKDRVMTMAAYTIDQDMVAEGFAPTDPDYFEELDRRLRAEFPHKFAGAKPAAKPAASPTIQNRAAAAPTSGKMKVVITAEDRRFAEQMGLDIQTYAREKARRERAQQSATQYTEIM